MSVPGIWNSPAQAQRQSEIEGNHFIPGFYLKCVGTKPACPIVGAVPWEVVAAVV